MGKEAKFVVRLSIKERLFLNGLVAETRTAKERALRARLFLRADADGSCSTDSQIANAFEISTLKVARLAKALRVGRFGGGVVSATTGDQKTA